VPDEAFEWASARIRSIEDDMEALGRAPFQGTLWPDLLPDLRWVTRDRARVVIALVSKVTRCEQPQPNDDTR
jgi:hypothetical protein